MRRAVIVALFFFSLDVPAQTSQGKLGVGVGFGYTFSDLSNLSEALQRSGYSPLSNFQKTLTLSLGYDKNKWNINVETGKGTQEGDKESGHLQYRYSHGVLAVGYNLPSKINFSVRPAIGFGYMRTNVVGSIEPAAQTNFENILRDSLKSLNMTSVNPCAFLEVSFMTKPTQEDQKTRARIGIKIRCQSSIGDYKWETISGNPISNVPPPGRIQILFGLMGLI
jgi:hypothetical protein